MLRMRKAISRNISKSGRHPIAIGSRENGNPNAKEKPVYCFRIPAYAGKTRGLPEFLPNRQGKIVILSK